MSYQYYRWKWENYPRIGFVERVPIHIDLEVTTRCNYACWMCEHSSPYAPEPIDMPFDMIIKVIDEFAEKGGSSIKFVYLGEGLMYKYLPEAIAYAKQKGIIDTMIATNASLLTEEKGKDLIEAGLDWIILSVDSCKPEIYKQIRINGNLKIVARNIQNFYKLRSRLGSPKPKITIQAIRQDLNRDEIDSGEYHEFWRPYVDVIRISRLESYGNSEVLDEAPDFFCTSPFQRLTIRADGKIALCCGERRENKVFGKIKEDTIESVWLGREFNTVRDYILKGKAHLLKPCQTCSLLLNHHRGV